MNVDANDQVWIIHRAGSLEPNEVHATTNPPIAQCCGPAPPVLQFDQEGTLISSWGGPGQGYDWPDSNHGVTIDYKGNVWIGGNGQGTPPAGAAAAARGQQPAAARGAQPAAAARSQSRMKSKPALLSASRTTR